MIDIVYVVKLGRRGREKNFRRDCRALGAGALPIQCLVPTHLFDSNRHVFHLRFCVLNTSQSGLCWLCGSYSGESDH